MILASQLAFSQQFEGKISEVTQNGLHQIALTPAARSFSDNNIHFIRIYDAQKNEVPYLVYKREITASSFVSFPILSKTAVPNVATSVIISNQSGVNVSSIILKIANTKVPKNYSLSGSNDSLKRFGLINDESVYDLYAIRKTFTERTFTFPLNSYKYLKFNFIDKNSLPINVLEARIIKNAFLADTATTLNNFEQKISTDKTTKKTTIHIEFEQPQVLNGIKLDISAPNLYVRNAQIVVNRTREVKKKEEIYQETLDYFELNSKSPNQFSLGNIFEKEFSFIIENEDKPALKRIFISKLFCHSVKNIKLICRRIKLKTFITKIR